MAQTCDNCHAISYRLRYQASTKKFLGIECGCSAPAAVMVDPDNPFRTSGELILAHVHDSEGKPLRVTSRRQLEEAQQKHNFVHVPTNMDRANWDRPAQQRAYTVGDHYKRKFARG